MMSKLLVLVAAVLCLATAVSAQTAPTQIVFTSFDTATCGTSVFNTTRNAGECQSANGQYTTAYCSNDGANVYMFTFTDASCNSSYVSSVTQIPTTCGWLAAKIKYTCVNPTAGPASPMAFPPAGWAQSSSCVNATNNYAPATTCSANGDANIHCTQSAAITGVCRKITFGNVLSQSTGCTASGQSAVISYSDDKCGTMISATVVTPGCYNGAQPSSSGSNTVASLPNKGYTSYDNDACAASTTKAPVTTLFTDSCYNSLKFDCSTVNGTTSGTFTTYADATGKGLCPANAVQSTLVQPVGVCQKGLVFTCAFTPVPTGAASATGASMVAMIVAAIVALVASLSL